MIPKLSEHTAHLAQVKRGLDQISEGFFTSLPTTEAEELGSLFASFNRMSKAVAAREESLRDENVQLATAVSRIETLLDASIDGVAFIGQDLSFSFVNRRFCEILGLRPGELSRKNVIDAQVLWQDTLNGPQRLLRVLSPVPHDNVDGTLDVIDEIVEVNGAEPRYAQAYGAPVLDDDGAYAGRIISLHDNTREMELDRLKTEFISVVSHELRTPLTSIKGYTDLLISGATGEINEIQREFLGILQASANRLGNLINDILDLSRIDAGRMEVKHIPVDYTKIIGDLARLMKASADEKEISLDVSYPQDMPMVSGDPDKIIQILSNLLSNAVKYTPEGGWIKILVEVTGDATVRTCIADSGIGISPSDQKRLFQKFFRADNSLTREAGGTGLGLVIVKSIVELLGGAIWVNSEAGRGSKFYYTLPLCAGRRFGGLEDSADEEQSAAGVPDRGMGLVLIVDTNSSVRETLQHSLHRRGYGIISAGGMDEALQKARQHKPDVILLDVMMNYCAGFNILSTLVSEPATAALPVIALSMDADTTGEKLTLGAICCSAIPVDFSPLIDALNEQKLISNQAVSVLVVSFGTVNDIHAAHAGAMLAMADLHAEVVKGSGEAIMAIVSNVPDAIVIFADTLQQADVHSFLSAVKSENDFARIPVLLATNSNVGEEVFFHIGGANPHFKTAVDYIAEQVSAVLRLNSYRHVIPNSGDEGPESGILNDN